MSVFVTCKSVCLRACVSFYLSSETPPATSLENFLPFLPENDFFIYDSKVGGKKVIKNVNINPWDGEER